ncbi:NUDIX hydrolase [Paenibacillus silviterrae]|uniref:NUDIX hydrolase n=1 Tax=Paenibacillus silviterrae TaxID=3242194 RepID=UPI0032B1C1AD
MTHVESETKCPVNDKMRKYRTPDGYTSDIAVFTIVSDKQGEHKPPTYTLKLMLIRRAKSDQNGKPNIEGGKWALPGGFVHEYETALEAAHRELAEETGVNGIFMKHFAVYDKPGRDPRGWIISNAFYAIVREEVLQRRKAADDAEDVELFAVHELDESKLAFDHAMIIQEAVEVIRRELLQTTMFKEFLPEEFTLSELRNLLLLVAPEDPAIKIESTFSANARKKYKFLENVMEAKDGVLRPKTTKRTSHRPAELFRYKETKVNATIF